MEKNKKLVVIPLLVISLLWTVNTTGFKSFPTLKSSMPEKYNIQDLPDFTVTNIMPGCRHAYCLWCVSIKNIGKGTYEGDLTVKIKAYLFGIQITTLSTSSFSTFPPGRVDVLPFMDIWPGLWKFNATVNPSHKIEESNYENNYLIKRYLVLGSWPFIFEIPTYPLLKSSTSG